LSAIEHLGMRKAAASMPVLQGHGIVGCTLRPSVEGGSRISYSIGSDKDTRFLQMRYIYIRWDVAQRPLASQALYLAQHDNVHAAMKHAFSDEAPVPKGLESRQRAMPQLAHNGIYTSQ